MQLVIDELMVMAAVYHIGENSHSRMKDILWLYIESKIVKMIANRSDEPANIDSPCRGKYWTCSGCKNINFNVENCACGSVFSLKLKGWRCSCSRKNSEQNCQCGNKVDLCLSCNAKYFIFNKAQKLTICNSCKIWNCDICKEENQLPLNICKKCSNPSYSSFSSFEFMSLPQ